jgi:hypothetical protein
MVLLGPVNGRYALLGLKEYASVNEGGEGNGGEEGEEGNQTHTRRRRKLAGTGRKKRDHEAGGRPTV